MEAKWKSSRRYLAASTIHSIAGSTEQPEAVATCCQSDTLQRTKRNSTFIHHGGRTSKIVVEMTCRVLTFLLPYRRVMSVTFDELAICTVCCVLFYYIVLGYLDVFMLPFMAYWTIIIIITWTRRTMTDPHSKNAGAQPLIYQTLTRTLTRIILRTAHVWVCIRATTVVSSMDLNNIHMQRKLIFVCNVRYLTNSETASCIVVCVTTREYAYTIPFRSFEIERKVFLCLGIVRSLIRY